MSFRGGDSPRWGTGHFAKVGPRLDALIADMEGGVNRVSFGDMRRNGLSGTGNPLAINNEAVEAGATEMVLTGFEPNSVIAEIGDYVGGDERTHIVTNRVVADSAGAGTLTVRPAFVASIAEGAAELIEPRGWFRIASEAAGNNTSPVGQLTEYDLEFVEDVTPVRTGALALAGDEPAVFAIDGTTENLGDALFIRDPDDATNNKRGAITQLWPSVAYTTVGGRGLVSTSAAALSISAADFNWGDEQTFFFQWVRATDDKPFAILGTDAAAVIALGTVSFTPDYYDLTLADAALPSFATTLGIPADDERQHLTIVRKNGGIAWSWNGGPIGWAEHIDVDPLTVIRFYNSGGAEYKLEKFKGVPYAVPLADVPTWAYPRTHPLIINSHPLGLYKELLSEGVDRFREPSPIDLGVTNGVSGILVFMMGRSVAADVGTSGSDEVPSALYQRRLFTDGKLIWSDTAQPTLVLTAPNWPTGGHIHSAIGVKRTYGPNRGRIIAAFSRLDGATISSERNVYTITTNDDGDAYSAPAKIFDVGDYSGTYMIPGPLGQITEYPADSDYPNRLAFPLNDSTGLRVAYTDNDGGAWSLTGQATGTPATYQPNEARWALLPDGTMVIVARVQQGSSDVQNTAYVYHWTGSGVPTYQGTIPDYEGAAVAGGLIQLDYAGEFSADGRFMHVTALTGGYERHGGQISYSEDGGDTLQEHVDLIPQLRPASYQTVLRAFPDRRIFWHIGEYHLQENTNGYTSCVATLFRALARGASLPSPTPTPTPTPPPTPPPTPAERITNGTFDTDTSGWTAVDGATLSVVSGRLRVTNGTTNYGGAYQAMATTIGVTYAVEYDSLSGTTVSNFRVGNSIGGIEHRNDTASGTGNTFSFVATATTTYVTVYNGGNASGLNSEYDNISVFG